MRPALAKVVAYLAATAVIATAIQSRSATAQEEDFRSWDDRRKETFLLEAKVQSEETLEVGVTNSKRLTLSDGGVTHDAHFQTVQEDPSRERGPRDYWGFNIAAYRLDRILGLNMVPPSVERRIGGSSGALTWWVDDVAMMEEERAEKGLRPPDPAAWAQQLRNFRVFTQLTYNIDANAGNLLITDDWTMRLIDFTRAFGRNPNLIKGHELTFIDRRLFEALAALDIEQLREVLSPYVGAIDLKGLIKRRDKILAKFDDFELLD